MTWPDPDHDILGVQHIQLGDITQPYTPQEHHLGCRCKSHMNPLGFRTSYSLFQKPDASDSAYLKHRQQGGRPAVLCEGWADVVRPVAASAQSATPGSSAVCSLNPVEIAATVELAQRFSVSDRYFVALAGPTVPNRMLFLT